MSGYEADKLNVAYIGRSIKAIKYIDSSDEFNLLYCFCEEKGINQEIKDYVSTRQIELILVDKHNITKVLQTYSVDCVIVYGCGIIIDEKAFESNVFYNIHSGSLVFNRGNNPIVWSILNNEKNSEITLHKMTREIDAGEVIAIYPVEIGEGDGSESLINKLEEGIPYLLKQLYNFIKGNDIEKISGIYRPRPQMADYTIDIDKDSEQKIISKVRSQDIYNGALVLNNYVDKVDSEEVNRKMTSQNNELLIDIHKRIHLYYKK